MRDYTRRMLAAAEASGVVKPSVLHRGRGHPRLVGLLDGRPFEHAIAGSPCRGRCVENSVCHLKRAIAEARSRVRARQQPEPQLDAR